MESKKDERTWKDIDSVKLHRMQNVRSTEDRSVDAKSYIEASGLESALKYELSKVLSMPSDLRPPPQLLLETIGKAFKMVLKPAPKKRIVAFKKKRLKSVGTLKKLV